jgi:hypothetical protein
MDKKLLNEEIQNMKFLFGYKPGRVISEQDIDYTTDDYLDTNNTELEESNPFKIGGGFEDYNFPDKLKDRLSDIYDLLDEVMEDPDNDPSDYSDMYDFAGVIISQVLNKLRDEFGEDFEEYEDDVDDYLRNNEDETIFDFYNSRSGFDDEDDEDEFEFDEDMNEQYDDQNGMNWVQNTTMDRQNPIDDDNDVEGSVKSILKKHHLLDNVVEPDDSRILVRNQSSEVVQKILSLLPSFTELGFLAFINCESADFSDVDICGLPNLAFINLNGTENNFEEQDYECANTEDSPFYFLE